MKKLFNIALVGNPNSGKSSLFNILTGLNQKVGNFPGVTVEKKSGYSRFSESLEANVIDLPGTYSLYPKREDEWISYRVLMQQDQLFPDLVLIVADASNLKRNLLFCSQIIDLKIPVVVALTMADLAKRNGTEIDLPGLERELGVPVVSINPRKNKGIRELKKSVELVISNLQKTPPRDFIEVANGNAAAIRAVKSHHPHLSNYAALHFLINHEHFALSHTEQDEIMQVKADNHFNSTRTQAEEIMNRYGRIKHVMQQTVVEADPVKKSLLNEKLDNILLHRTWGYLILLGVLFLLFQSIFWIASYPMDAIEWVFSRFSGWLTTFLPETLLSDLFINGIVAGLSGIMLFVPQIMILFGLITLLEDSGYMARISFLTDKLMRKVGLNGKSVMPMISGYACAVPAIMSARNIENKKERLLTIMVTPLMSCSARLPVYTILIALVIPRELVFGVLSLQGLVMMGLYLLGTLFALIVSWVMKWFIKSTERSYFILELPSYRSPRWKNMVYTMINKARIFVVEAGKVIMVISVLLWALSTYGPKKKMQAVTERYDIQMQNEPARSAEWEKMRSTGYLENSYAGMLGKAIEPAIRPLGYDWKIGIALITSFAAREVFVGTMATLYSVEESNSDNNRTLREKMRAAVREDGTKVYTLATGVSLMVFYVLAMQCMSTIVIVRKELGSWKWALIQVLYMTALAYVMSLIAYQLLK
ncbi:MAG: ferrous iron transport protein B [Chitinophagaceae bacterium]|nr:MAG: ferrous iron transport protein B [Chitinophagaceae bacterium]